MLGYSLLFAIFELRSFPFSNECSEVTTKESRYRRSLYCLNMSTVDSYGPASQTLTFLETEEVDFGADTQGSEFEFNDFTLPSQTQTQDHPSQPLVNGIVEPPRKIMADEKILASREDAIKEEEKDVKIEQIAKGVGELNFEEDEDEGTFSGKDLPPHACR